MPTWAPLSFTFSGIWEIGPDNLAELLSRRPDAAQVVDVREAAEYTDTLGHIDGARLMPLAALEARRAELDRARPVVTVCRSGTRSAQACVLLARAGFPQVANLAGGMLRWSAQGHPVQDGAS